MTKQIAVLAALAGFVLASAATKPSPRLAHDPNDAARVEGMGSVCREGCNEDDQVCTNHMGEINGFPIFLYADEIVWFEHWECAWALGADTCTAGQDTLCYQEYRYTQTNCNGTPTIIPHTTSTCGPSYIPPQPPGGN